MAFLFRQATTIKSKRNGYEPAAGVGIVFKSGPDQALFVKSIVEDGPASKADPPIRVNDCLLKVDGEEVYRMPIEKAVEYILGERDSPITLTFQRFAGNKLNKFDVRLLRGTPATLRAQNAAATEEIAYQQQQKQQLQQPQPQQQQQQQQRQQQQQQQLIRSADQNQSNAEYSATMRGMTLQERQALEQTRLSERLQKIEDMKGIAALSFTGASNMQDAAGIYEGDMLNVICFDLTSVKILSLNICALRSAGQEARERRDEVSDRGPVHRRMAQWDDERRGHHGLLQWRKVSRRMDQRPPQWAGHSSVPRDVPLRGPV